MIANKYKNDSKIQLLTWVYSQFLRWSEPPSENQTADLGNLSEVTKSAVGANETEASQRLDFTMSGGE